MIRVQRQRTKGWRMPDGAVYVGRPTRWGNYVSLSGRSQPVVVGDCWDWAHVARHLDGYDRRIEFPIHDGMVTITAEIAVAMFRVEVGGWNHDYRMRWLKPLRGATALACWCPLDQPCHADVLIELLERAS